VVAGQPPGGGAVAFPIYPGLNQQAAFAPAWQVSPQPPRGADDRGQLLDDQA